MIMRNKKYTAVDIGSYGIKVVTIKQKKQQIELVSMGYAKLPFETINGEKINDSSVVANILNNILSAMDYQSDRIITTLPSNNLVIRKMRLPEASDQELKEAIIWEAEEILPYPVEYASLDYIVLNKQDEEMDLLLVAAKKSIVYDFLEPFYRLALEPVRVNAQPLALMSLLQYQKKAENTIAIIDIGAASSRIIIGDKHNIFLSRNIDIGGEKFTKYLMEERELDFISAEDYKMTNDVISSMDKRLIENQPDYSGMSAGILGGNHHLSLANKLAREIEKSLDYYAQRSKNKGVEQIFITGGGSRLNNIIEIISGELNRNIEEIYPLEGIKIVDGAEVTEGEFSLAIGLSISEVMN